jgi:nucleotide-binding universal stress UspA family protein
MAKRILVPLDGTEEAEAGLDLIADAARGGGAVVRLLRVMPMPENICDLDGHILAYADQEGARLEAEAMDYLSCAAVRFDGATVEAAVRFGEPVPEILLEAETFAADLIAMTARRTCSLTRLMLGTTADQVTRRVDIPVVLYRAAARRS